MSNSRWNRWLILGVLCLVSLWANLSANRVSEQVFLLEEAPAVKVMDQLDERYGTAISMRRHETMNGLYVVAPREILEQILRDMPELDKAKSGPPPIRPFHSGPELENSKSPQPRARRVRSKAEQCAILEFQLFWQNHTVSAPYNAAKLATVVLTPSSP